jgi:hypothetical protein
VLCAGIASREMRQVDRANDVSMPAVIGETHQNGTLSVSAM